MSSLIRSSESLSLSPSTHSLASATRPRGIIMGGFVAAWLALAFVPRSSSADELNACGCSQSPAGECVCTKQAKCGCPGMCEPVGCAAKREKEFKRELEAETRRAAGGSSTSRTREHENKRTAPATEGEEAAAEKVAAPKKTPTLSAAQEKSLRRLLDAYLEAHPDAQHRSVGEVRASLSANTGG